MSDTDPAPWIKFGLAGVSCMLAACVTNPIDVIKIRLQLQGELVASQSVYETGNSYRGMTRGLLHIVSHEGIKGLYKGLPASLLREGSYSSIRIGAYEPIRDAFGGGQSLGVKLLAGMCSGSIGAFLANPTDLVKVRMQAAASAPPYQSTISAFGTIAKREGMHGLYRGVGPTTMRAAILTGVQVGTYDHIKHVLLRRKLIEEGPAGHFITSMAAGFLAAVATSPVDVVKSRMMNQSANAIKYSSSWDCVRRTAGAEGILGFYKGLWPNFIRIGPHTIVTFMILERLRSVFGLKPV